MPKGRILAIVLATLALAALACGGGGQQPPAPVAAPTLAPSPTPPPIPTRPAEQPTPTPQQDAGGAGQAGDPGSVQSLVLYGSTRDGLMGLYFLSTDSSEVSRLSPGNAALTQIVWPDVSPGGDKLAVASVQGNVGMRPVGIFTMNLDGSDPVQVTFGEGVHPSWSPDGTRIAYTCEAGTDVCVVNADGTGRVNLTEGNELTDRYPDWTADGRIVFMSNRDTGGPGFSEIYIMDVDGQNATRLTNDDNAYNAHPNVWREGGLIVYESDRDVAIGSELYVMDVNGGGQRRLTNDGVWNQAPRWSPDGSEIMYGQQIEEASLDLFVMDANGRNISQLTEHPAEDGGLRLGYDWLPAPVTVAETTDEDERTFEAEAPDGSSQVTNAVLFAASSANCADCLESGIYAVNFDGANLTRLPLDGLYPAWDPDFERIAYTNNGELWIANTDGSNPTQMTQAFMGLSAPRWDEQGFRIVADCTPYGQHDICMIDVATGDIHNITIENTHDTGVAFPTWFEDNFVLGSQIVNPEGSPFDSVPAPGPVSPDGTMVVSVIDGQVAVVPFNGDPTVLTDSEAAKGYPHWGPNNDLVVYTQYPGDGRLYLWMARADGSAAYQLVSQPVAAGGSDLWLGYSWAP